MKVSNRLQSIVTLIIISWEHRILIKEVLLTQSNICWTYWS